MEFGIQDEIAQFNSIGALKILLADKTTGSNIIWATDTYESEGELFYRDREITSELVTFLYGGVIKNRTEKDASRQSERTRKRAEVFTPLWICKKMIDYIDDDFYRNSGALLAGDLSTSLRSAQDDNVAKPPQSQCVIPSVVEESPQARCLSQGGTASGTVWQAYVQNRRLEITCGEAPYLVSRYDVSSGERILIENRIGILDRKLRVISQNVDTQTEWFDWVIKAYQATYGYEFQGDSLLIARVNLLATFVEYYTEKWHEKPGKADIKKIANIIAWNIWQMDGLNCRVPYCKTGTYQMSLFDSDVISSGTGAVREVEKSPREKRRTSFGGSFDYALTGYAQDDMVEKQPLCRVKNWNTLYNVYFNNLNEGKGKMKFDYIIGNPPYQDETLGENVTFAPPIYHKFIDSCYPIATCVELIHPARFLFNAGSTPKEWNRKMLNDEHLKTLDYWAESSAVFPNVDIKGGVIITLHNESENYGAIDIFTPFEELNLVMHKVKNNKFESFSKIIITAYAYRTTDKLHEDYPEVKSILSKGHAYDLKSNVFEKLPYIFLNEKPEDGYEYIQILGLEKMNRVFKYVRRDYINDVINFEKYKVFIAGANGSGAIGETLSTPLIGQPLIGQPLIGHTESFISIGCFDTQEEAEACLKYVKTKFARALLGILKVTQAITPEKWKYVPLQDFTENSDIDWSKSVAEIDRQLYKKYGLDEREISFIETNVKEMV